MQSHYPSFARILQPVVTPAEAVHLFRTVGVRFLLTASLAKVEHAIQETLHRAARGESVVIFTDYHETAQQLAARLPADDARVLDQRVPSDQRLALVKSFHGGLIPMLVTTFRIASTGLTLPTATTTILVDRPHARLDLSRARTFQAERRAPNAVTSVWLQFGRLDHERDRQLLGRA